MSLFCCNCHSNILKTYITYHVVLPNEFAKDPNEMTLAEYYAGKSEKYRVLWLLHGAFADGYTWLRYTSIEQYADDNDVAVVMPSFGNSFYADMAHGARWFTFLTQELPLMVRASFPISAERRDNYIGGLSMGGYGALKAALSYPEKYSACLSLSGALDAADMVRSESWQSSFSFDDIFGSTRAVSGTRNDLFYLASLLGEQKKEFPAIYLAVGEDDPFLAANLSFSAHLKRLGAAHDIVSDAGAHDFAFWDPHLKQGMARLLKKR